MLQKLFTFGPLWKYGIAFCAFAAIIATESDGVTKNSLPRIMFLSPSPEKIYQIYYINRGLQKKWLTRSYKCKQPAGYKKNI